MTPEKVDTAPRQLPPVAVRWLFWLAALSYAATAGASALTLRLMGYPNYMAVAPIWFLGCFIFVWRSGRELRPLPILRKVADAGAVVITAMFLAKVGQLVLAEGADIRTEVSLLAAEFLMVLQALRAPIVTRASDAEGFLFASLILAVFCSTFLPWQSGAPLLAVFIWLWLGAMALARLVSDTERRLKYGAVVAGSTGAGRALSTGLGLALMTVALGAGVFLSMQGTFARLGARGAGLDRKLGGEGMDYTNSLDTGGWTDARPSPDVILRVKAPRYIARFRVQAFDAFQAPGWVVSTAESTRNLGGNTIGLPDDLGMGYTSGLAGLPFTMEVTVEQSAMASLVTAERPQEVDGDRELLLDAEGALRAAKPFPPGLTYTVRGKSVAWERVDLASCGLPDLGEGVARYTDIRGVSAPVRDLAAQWAGSAFSPWTKALAITDNLRSGFKYRHELTFAVRQSGADIIDYFLFDARSGNCLNFSSALVLMLRSVGVPCRIAMGYLGHDYDNATGDWLLHASDGHAWAEVPLLGVGWVPLDPVPPSLVSGYPVGGTPAPGPAALPASKELPTKGKKLELRVDPEKFKQNLIDFIKVAGPWLALGLVLSWVALTALQAFRTRLREALVPLMASMDQVRGSYYRVGVAAAHRGIPRRPAQTPLEYGRRLLAEVPALGPGVVRLAEIYTESVYSPAGVPPAQKAEAGTLGREIVKALKRRK